MKKNTSNRTEILLLKFLLGLYIVLCLIIAGLNYGLAPGASEEVRELTLRIWHFYENQFKTFLIIIGSILTIRIQNKKASMHKRNLLGFICAAAVLHIIGPAATGISDLYFFSMPLPWSTSALQLMTDQSQFYQKYFPLWGASGISAVLVFYGIVSLIVFGGTLIMGRRWQCSTLCLFNGFISEVFTPAFPFFGKKKKIGKTGRRLFSITRWCFLTAGISFTLFWIYSVFFSYNNDMAEILAKVEVYKYLSIELLMAMFFWIAFTGRGYCYYCPLGTVLGGISGIAGQKIHSDGPDCISCRKCDKTCPMNIDISTEAQKGEPIISSMCVGCGHCIDNCPTDTLRYSTSILEKLKGKKTK